ncbi:hypothetical protein ABKW28_11665 [Nocardioides sp. 31GB23]|uniref:hypothetical protein n=1 Tax=Nocardioides sp. 31GB23 TaxID=3156065 RepID=UPI0032AF0705
MTPEAGIALVALAVTVGVAVVTWHRANRADRHADQALEFAHAAEARADRLERLQLERRDVRWVQRDAPRTTISFLNAGSDPAYDVQLIVDSVTGLFPRRTQSHGNVAPAEVITMNLQAEAQAELDALNASRVAGSVLPRPVTVQASVTWQSALGVPASYEFDRITT